VLALLLEPDDSANTVALQTKIDTLTSDMTQARNVAYQAISKRQAGAGGGQVPPAFRAHFNNELKPFDLSLANTPAEYRMWKDELQTYFTCNELTKSSAPVQTNYLRKCLDLDLVTRTNADCDATIPVFTPKTGLLALLDEVFKTQYPILTRRMTWASCKQTQGEILDAYIDRYNTLAKEADLSSMKEDDFLTYGLLSGMNDQHSTIKQKLMGKTGIKYNVLVTKAREWSASKRCEKQSSAPKPAQVNFVKSGQKPAWNGAGNSNSGSSLPPVPASIKNTPRSIHGKCFVCGDASHDKYNCPQKQSASCRNCGGRHLQAVCLKEYIAWKKTLPGQQQSGASSAKAHTVTAPQEKEKSE
jgi:hypothetical protein